MGWAGGSELAEDIWKLVSKYIPADKKKRIAKKMIRLFENQDCDTIYEADNLIKDAGVKFLDE